MFKIPDHPMVHQGNLTGDVRSYCCRMAFMVPVAFCLSDQAGKLATQTAGAYGLAENSGIWKRHITLLIIVSEI